eukprot:Hpha_TRINITY_DN15292_c8_g5::TRINITY_DN15292_c8_g5_i2::g.68361::m.68361
MSSGTKRHGASSRSAMQQRPTRFSASPVLSSTYAPGRASKSRTAELAPAVAPSSRKSLAATQTQARPEPSAELLAEAQAAADRQEEVMRLTHNNGLLREELNRLIRAVNRKVDGSRRDRDSPQRGGLDHSAPSSRGQVSGDRSGRSGRSFDSAEHDLDVLVGPVDTHRDAWLAQHSDAAEVQAVVADIHAQRREAARLRGYLRMQKDQMEVLQTMSVDPARARGSSIGGGALDGSTMDLPPPPPPPVQGRGSAAGSHGGSSGGARQRAGYSSGARRPRSGSTRSSDGL